MAEATKQYNFKLSENLLSALKAKAERENTNVTALIVEGIKHVLGVVDGPEPHIDNQLYERLAQIESRLTEIEKSDIEVNIYNRIDRLESQLQELREFVSENLEAKESQAVKHQNPIPEKLPLLEALAAAEEKTDSTPSQSVSQREIERMTGISQRQLSKVPLNDSIEVTIEGKPHRIQCTERPGERKPSRWIVEPV